MFRPTIIFMMSALTTILKLLSPCLQAGSRSLYAWGVDKPEPDKRT